MWRKSGRPWNPGSWRTKVCANAGLGISEVRRPPPPKWRLGQGLCLGVILWNGTTCQKKFLGSKIDPQKRLPQLFPETKFLVIFFGVLFFFGHCIFSRNLSPPLGSFFLQHFVPWTSQFASPLHQKPFHPGILKEFTRNWCFFKVYLCCFFKGLCCFPPGKKTPSPPQHKIRWVIRILKVMSFNFSTLFHLQEFIFHGLG